MAKKAKKKKPAKAAKPKPKKKSAPKAASKTKAKKRPAKVEAEKAKKAKSPDVPEQRLLNFKVFSTEYETMKKLARKHAGGNLSAWVRFACVNAKPTAVQQTRFDHGDY